MKILITFFLVAVTIQPAFGFRAPYITDEERYEEAEAVYLGIVSGVRIPALETKPPEVGEELRTISVGRTDYELRVMVGQTLKGKPKELLVFQVRWCGGGYAELGDKATVYGSPGDRWYVRSHTDR